MGTIFQFSNNLISILSPYRYDYTMKKVEFWINMQQYKEAIKKLGDKSKFYGFAKKAFLKALEELNNGNKD